MDFFGFILLDTYCIVLLKPTANNSGGERQCQCFLRTSLFFYSPPQIAAIPLGAFLYIIRTHDSYRFHTSHSRKKRSKNLRNYAYNLRKKQAQKISLFLVSAMCEILKMIRKNKPPSLRPLHICLVAQIIFCSTNLTPSMKKSKHSTNYLYYFT